MKPFSKPFAILFLLFFLAAAGCEGNYEVKPDPRSCTGDAMPCDKLPGASLCDAQEGCAWDFVNKVCIGDAVLCEDYDDGYDCECQWGCYWE